MRNILIGRLVGALIAGLLSVGLSACGNEDEKADSASSGHSKRAKAVEKAFLTGMVHHHESAVDMAEIAKERGSAPFITKLGTTIIETQQREISEMKKMHRRLVGSELEPDPGAHDGLGLSAEEAGMTHDKQTNQTLRAAKPFDRAFVDEMVPHHEGAIKMSRVLLKHSKDAELRRLAESIVTTQEREVEQMNSFRTAKFGGPVPAGAGHGGGHGGGHSEEMPKKKHEAPAGGGKHGASHTN